MKRKRRIYFGADVAYISLASAKGVAIVDIEDVARVSGVNWCGTGGYAYGALAGRTVFMHRLLLDFPSAQVDHADRDRLNNRRGNLRICTHVDNARNKAGSAASGLKGVARAGRKWRAYIRDNGKSKHLGVYATPELAHAAYCRAARQLHGEFACTVF